MTTNRQLAEWKNAPALVLALIFFTACTGASYARWSNFEYRTFDLAYYVQALWQLIHGRFEVSVEGVPLLGNHVEPIVFLIAPLFAIFRHPMVLVVVQNAALAAMGPLAFAVCRQIGLRPVPSLLLASASLLTPATAYVALHEFHPEALAAPFLLLMIYARVTSAVRLHWVGIIALLACKENMAVLVVSYCAVHLILERKRPLTELRSWYVCPLILSISWFALCTKVITPALNAGTIDYLALYDRLGTSPGDILLNAIMQPHRIGTALLQSLRAGNLVWALLLPFLGLSLLRGRWLIIASPILLQHLLSWRSSEWQIYFHYAAPLIPLFWIALVEGLAGLERRKWGPDWMRSALPLLVVVACALAQLLLGPAASVSSSIAQWFSATPEQARKIAFIQQIPPQASLVAPLPYLSHLAMREKLFSLHYILKGLKTLSRSGYETPSPTDFVLIDYDDSATFDPDAGFYHPAMKTVDGRVIPSSDSLLHDFLRQSAWTISSSNELTLLTKTPEVHPDAPPPAKAEGATALGPGTVLTSVSRNRDLLTTADLEIGTGWNLDAGRDYFPWMFLKLTPKGLGSTITISRGLCSIEVVNGLHQERWRVTRTQRIADGTYNAEVIFVDHARALWSRKSVGQAQEPPNAVSVSIGEIKVEPSDRARH